MSDILNFEIEVKKMYPDATCNKTVLGYRVSTPERGRISPFENSKERAWRAAYELILEERKTETT